MTSTTKSRLWRGAKLAMAVGVLFFVGRQFYRDLSGIDSNTLTLRWEWLIASAVLYLVGMSFSGLYWHRLLGAFGHRPPAYATFRAYFLGQLGKYVPGKAFALLIAPNLLRPFGVRFGVSILTSFYEVLTTMAAGALVAAAFFLAHPPEIPGLAWPPALTGLLLVGVCGVPLLPWVFNFLVARMARRFSYIEALSIPRLGFWPLLQGLTITACGWMLLGLSTAAMLVAVLPDVCLDGELILRSTAAMGFAYVAGFLVIFMPSGVGVREYLLHFLLAFAGPAPAVTASVLLLRVTWTSAEFVLAGVLYCNPTQSHSPS